MKENIIWFLVHRLSGTWSFKVHKQKENADEGWEEIGFIHPNFYTKEAASKAAIDFVSSEVHKTNEI